MGLAAVSALVKCSPSRASVFEGNGLVGIWLNRDLYHSDILSPKSKLDRHRPDFEAGGRRFPGQKACSMIPGREHFRYAKSLNSGLSGVFMMNFRTVLFTCAASLMT